MLFKVWHTGVCLVVLAFIFRFVKYTSSFQGALYMKSNAHCFCIYMIAAYFNYVHVCVRKYTKNVRRYFLNNYSTYG
jgi:hypothetical protein